MIRGEAHSAEPEAVAPEAASPEQFVRSLLRVQARLVEAEAGAILRVEADGSVEAIALWPSAVEAHAGDWRERAAAVAPRVAHAGETASIALSSGDDLYGAEPALRLIVVPLRTSAPAPGVSALVVRATSQRDFASKCERLEVTRSLLEAREMQAAAAQSGSEAARLRAAIELSAAATTPTRAKAAMTAFVDTAVVALHCQRASLGFVHDRVVKLEAMSHTETIVRKMRLIQAIEEVMEECVDQDAEILWPDERDAVVVNRAARDFAKEQDHEALLVAPLRSEDAVIGAFLLERDAPFTASDIASVRLACDVVAGPLAERRRADRWIGARAAAETRRWLGALLGPERVWIKVAALLALAAIAFLIFAKGMYRVESPFAIAAMERDVIAAPFEGFLSEVYVEIGDRVDAGETTLARLDTSELRLQLAAAASELTRREKEASIARRDREIAEAQIAEAAAAEARAEIELLRHRIERATLTSRIDGVVVEGEQRRRLGAPVQKGSVLFEVAPVDALRVELSAPEDSIADIKPGQRGALATAAYPGDRIPFVVESIEPVAKVVEGRNVFVVRARLEQTRPWMRPGMEGLAKVEIDRRRYAWIWTRRLVNWIRMQLWI